MQRNQSQARDACFACRNELLFCGESDPARCQPFLGCLSRHSVRVEECK
ncbi:hypothetical protein [Archangium lansingense]|uniref:Uncharacterized protein n=1 Tax=Archangium lansingense TaxID=2995310 RepID=A0ABT4AIU7_9BACT|nr:hypothetical protein [Archangium lansinium]MCY1081613.1 hypothetical protein [Archangium lansinium]